MPSSSKPKRVSMSAVWKSDDKDNLKTVGLPKNNGLGKADLIKNKRGKIVSKEASERSAAAYKGSELEKWQKCVTRAKQDLGLSGWVDLEGTTDNALYNRVYDYFEGKRKLD